MVLSPEIHLSSVIELKQICKHYCLGNNKLPVLHDINLTIQSGELVAIMGPSGSGKTTLMNILGLLDHANRGTYSFAGREVQALSPDELAHVRGHFIGFVFQSFYLLPKLNALHNVMLPLRYQRKSLTDANARAEVILQRVAMETYKQHKPKELSGGQQQRIAIARALVSDPKVILADEPTGSLDSHTGQDIMDLFIELNRNEGKTIIIITHDPKISQQCQRIINIKDGHISEE